MKENMLDVLMYLFENYTGGELDLSPDQESLRAELVEAGFAYGEIDKAFCWLEGLALQCQSVENYDGAAGRAVRVYNELETKKLAASCRGYLQFLEQVGVLDPGTRELVIDRLMALETREIELNQLKWVVLMVLFNQPGQEEAFARMEDLVYGETFSGVH